MLYSEIKKGCDKIYALLDKWEVRDALNALLRLADAVHDESFVEQAGKTQKKYEDFLHSRIEAEAEGGGGDFFRDILKETYHLTDEFRYKVFIQTSPLFSFVRKQGLETTPDYSGLHDLIRFQPSFEDGLHSMLFHQVFSSSFLTQKEADDLLAILRDEEHCRIAACQIVSALFLSIQVCFDIRKLYLLSVAAASRQQEIRARGYVCLLSVLSFYKERIPAWEEETGEILKQLVDSDVHFEKMVQLVTERFAIERETEEIVRRMREEILPEIARIGKEQMEATVEAMEDEENNTHSEWTVMPNDWLYGQLKEMNELQAEGGDMTYVSFMSTKRLPFFADLSHWFLPFIADHAEVQHAIAVWGGQSSVGYDVEVLTQFCNSDKYSFLLSLHSKASGGNPPLIDLLCNNAENIETFRKTQSQISDWVRVQQIAGQYIPDLYRFYHLHPHHPELFDPFASVPDFYTLPTIKSYLSPSVLRHIGNYFFRRKLYPETLNLFRPSVDMFLDTFEKEGEGGIVLKGELFGSMEEMNEIVEKTGYCYQMTGHCREALTCYLRICANKGESTWLAERIAKCYRQTGEPDRALEHYRICEQASPKDISLLIKIGSCLMEAEKHLEALDYFYKADFYHSSVRTWRPLAWMLFLLERHEDALRYYGNILKEEHPSMADYLNAGHAALAARRPISQTMGYYLKALSASKDLDSFMKHFRADIDHLHRVGVHDEELALLFDHLKYLRHHPD
ncbi:MAG: tetratricopeptide repeat protein [Tannerellaceae bacterium]|jgi:tetratricopeptide (TPR) repeat protein|nr:tetratricopeptide repeat protein [Tannerellaceae bacterium]